MFHHRDFLLDPWGRNRSRLSIPCHRASVTNKRGCVQARCNAATHLARTRLPCAGLADHPGVAAAQMPLSHVASVDAAEHVLLLLAGTQEHVAIVTGIDARKSRRVVEHHQARHQAVSVHHMSKGSGGRAGHREARTRARPSDCRINECNHYRT